MKYNILTVCNEGYAPFIKLFINSLFELVDIENVEKVYIYDTGLSTTTVKYLNLFPKVEVVNTDLVTGSNQIHDECWRKNTYSKTKFLLEILNKTNLPTFMIDSDCIFVQGFEDLINTDSHIVACSRNRNGFSKHIGSFFGAIDVDNSISFLNKWIENIDLLQNTTDLKHCESPALSKTISETQFKLQQIQEQIISAVFPDDTSRIIHLKSDYYAKTVKDRLSLSHAIRYTKRYL